MAGCRFALHAKLCLAHLQALVHVLNPLSPIPVQRVNRQHHGTLGPAFFAWPGSPTLMMAGHLRNPLDSISALPRSSRPALGNRPPPAAKSSGQSRRKLRAIRSMAGGIVALRHVAACQNQTLAEPDYVTTCNFPEWQGMPTAGAPVHLGDSVLLLAPHGILLLPSARWFKSIATKQPPRSALFPLLFTALDEESPVQKLCGSSLIPPSCEGGASPKAFAFAAAWQRTEGKA